MGISYACHIFTFLYASVEERQACRDEAREAFEHAGARFVINRLDELPALIETMEVA